MRKKIGVGIGLTSVIVIGFFVYSLGIVNIDEQQVVKPLQDIKKNLPEVPKIMTDTREKIVSVIEKEPSKIPEKIVRISKPELNIAKIESLIHDGINEQRATYGLIPLEYDSTISNVARAHSKDMAQNNYFEHQSLTGTQPWDRGFPYGYHTCGTKEAISLQSQYDELSRQYDRYPRTMTDQSQYQQATALYNQLNAISSRLNSLSQNKELFGGLAENISQNWTYDSITYINGVPSYNWNHDEDIAEKTVNGWMNSQGHRANILSGFHSEGIGVAIASDDKVYITENFC